MSNPIPDLVTTIIPVYNRPEMLGEAVRCVLEQTYRPIEVIIADDGSTDGDTARVGREFEATHPGVVRYYYQPNAGPGPARNLGLKHARGEFIQYLDSDDLLLPNKFARQVAALRDHPECGLAYCKASEYDRGTTPTFQVCSRRTGERLDTLFPYLLSGRCWTTGTELLRRTVTDVVGPWATFRQEEDWEYDARVAALGTRLVWCPEFLVAHIHHAGPRAGNTSVSDPVQMRYHYEAHTSIYRHARGAGIGCDDPHMQRYARQLFLLARQCGAAGLTAESRELFRLAREASGETRGRRLDFRLYRAAAAVLGWQGAGQLACWADRWRGL